MNYLYVIYSSQVCEERALRAGETAHAKTFCRSVARIFEEQRGDLDI